MNRDKTIFVHKFNNFCRSIHSNLQQTFVSKKMSKHLICSKNIHKFLLTKFISMHQLSVICQNFNEHFKKVCSHRFKILLKKPVILHHFPVFSFVIQKNHQTCQFHRSKFFFLVSQILRRNVLVAKDWSHNCCYVKVEIVIVLLPRVEIWSLFSP